MFYIVCVSHTQEFPHLSLIQAHSVCSQELLFVRSSCQSFIITTFYLISDGVVYVSLRFLYQELVQWTALAWGKLYVTLKVLRNSMHCTWDWWFCFPPCNCSSGSTVHPSCGMCFAALFHRDHSPGDLSHPLSCAGGGVGPCGLIYRHQ